MAQRDKVKELVGRGLNSYHTKSLQQMDRIEKKNKEQNHKISILSNELDNNYLTKTEEGSVISLEHSKEGMVYLDELQGNTLVNYCTDGSKEMTLNGDIDVEGTFVTTTEGVDNGKVDVMCEGNTLVNLSNHFIDKEKTFTLNSGDWYNQVTICDMSMIKLNVDYTLIYDIEVIENNTTWVLNTNTKMVIGQSDIKNSLQSHPTINSISNNGKGTTLWDTPCCSNNKILFNINTWNTLNSKYFSIRPIYYNQLKEGESIKYKIKNLILLEGNWTNKEVPSYFKGMKSVGECEDNKIEILSSTNDTTLKNIETYGITLPNELSDTFINGVYTKNVGKFIVNEKTDFVAQQVLGNTNTFRYSIEITGMEVRVNDNSPINSLGDTLPYSWSDQDTIHYKVGVAPERLFVYIPMEYKDKPNEYFKENPFTLYYELSTPIEFKLNKKEILLSEPLRSLPNGVCDEIIKQNGKWYVKRKLNETYIEVPSSGVTVDIIQDDKCRIIMADYPIDIKPKQITTTINVNCDKIPSLKQTDLDGTSPNYSYGISTRIATTKGIYMWVTKDKMPNQTLDGFKDFIKNNQPKIIYELETPIYEEIIDVELITYLDTTHISNNSIIPCNMKIKNSGYNAIIKPSTLYTVAIGTDKGGTIGMNLGGAKVTTTNNVAKITTPATLTDDSLRLYGKGRKGSKIRILEGDIINIPKHFTGIQSSFEDKVQTDGSYKIEVLSNNENLFRLEDLKYSTSAGNSARPIKNGFKIITDTVNYWHAVVSMELNVKPKTTYTLGVSKKVVINAYPNQEPSWGAGYVFIREYGDKVLTEGKVKDNTRTYFRFNSGENTKIRVTFATATDVTTQKGEYDFTDLDLRESKSNLEYVEHKSNKIQFSSIEPLRKWDRFVFKDGQLMIERGSKKVDLGVDWSSKQVLNTGIYRYTLNNVEGIYSMAETICNTITTVTIDDISDKVLKYFNNGIWYQTYDDFTLEELKEYFTNSNTSLIFKLKEPTYEEIPHELQKIILEGYENGTLFFDTNIPPTSTVTYAGETPIVKSVKLNKTEVLNNTNDINDNIIPYLMDMDYRVVMLQLATEELEGGVSMARLFGGTYEMIKRDILSKRLTREEYGYRLADYFNAGKLTEEQVRELEELR